MTAEEEVTTPSSPYLTREVVAFHCRHPGMLQSRCRSCKWLTRCNQPWRCRPPPLLHATAVVATSSYRCCYMPAPPLLHRDDDVLHAAAAVLHQAVAAATFDLRRCYIAVLPLLHQATGLVQAAAAVLHATAGVATPRRRRCYIRPPVCYMRPPPLLQAGAAFATSGRWRAP
jgi:hypothetical protein